MFEAPKKLKFRRFHKIKISNKFSDSRLFCPKLSDYGLQAISSGKMNASQIEAGRLVIRRFSKKLAFLKINIFPFLSVTKKPTSARMGKGKGKVDTWITPIRRARILYELSANVKKLRTINFVRAFKLVNKKLPIKTRPVKLLY